MTDYCEQMELPLFTSRSFDEIIASKGIRDVAIIPNPRLKSSWRVKINSPSGRRTLIVPAYFENSPENIKEAIVDWALLFPLKKRRKQSGFSRQKKILEHLVLDYITRSGNAHKKTRKIPEDGLSKFPVSMARLHRASTVSVPLLC